MFYVQVISVSSFSLLRSLNLSPDANCQHFSNEFNTVLAWYMYHQVNFSPVFHPTHRTPQFTRNAGTE